MKYAETVMPKLAINSLNKKRDSTTTNVTMHRRKEITVPNIHFKKNSRVRRLLVQSKDEKVLLLTQQMSGRNKESWKQLPV